MQQREPRVRLGAAPRRIAGEPRGLHLPESRCSNGGAGAGGRAYDRARLPSRSSHVPPGSSNLCTENAPRPPPASEHVPFGLYGMVVQSGSLQQSRNIEGRFTHVNYAPDGYPGWRIRTCDHSSFSHRDDSIQETRRPVAVVAPASTAPVLTDRAPRHRSSRRYRSRSSTQPGVVSPLAEKKSTASYKGTTFIPGACPDGRLDESGNNSFFLYRNRLLAL
jgi:hypothetical protein